MARFAFRISQFAIFLAGCFRHTPFALVTLSAVALCAGGCSSAPKATAVHYSAPSVAPVRTKIADSQASMAKVAVHAKDATAKVVQLEAATLATPELHDLAAGAHADIDALSQELTIAQTALGAADSNAAALQVKVETQTDLLNTCGDEKNIAIAQLDVIKRADAKHKKQRNYLLLAVAGLVGWILRGPLLALGKTVLGVAARLVIP